MVAFALSLALAAGWAAPREPAAVSDANVAQPCQWPTVVSFRAGEGKCTGTLVHPRVIVTAAHCMEDSAAGGIRFGEQFQPAAMIVDAERCGVHPQYLETGAPSSDIGWCVLSEPVEGIPPTPLVMGCETQWLRRGEPAVIVGLGISEEDEFFGTKRYAFTVLDSDLRGDGTVWVGDEEVNGCFGDSGGPAFVRSPEGTWHAIGVLAFGPDCGEGPVLYRALHDRIEWLETETGFDLSPCHDADGTWSPGPDCGEIAVDPLATDGLWSQRCAGERAAAPVCAGGSGSTDDASGTSPSRDTGEPPAPSTGASLDAPTRDDAGCGCRAPVSGEPAAWWWLLVGLGRPRSRSR